MGACRERIIHVVMKLGCHERKRRKFAFNIAFLHGPRDQPSGAMAASIKQLATFDWAATLGGLTWDPRCQRKTVEMLFARCRRILKLD
jgi:hypothetical protein